MTDVLDYYPEPERDLDLAFRRFSLDLSEPLETAAGRIDAREGFLVRVDDGKTVGLGEAAPLPGWTESLADCERGLERASEAIEDGALAAIETVEEQVAARHAVTLALADLRATRDATPLYRYLGAETMVARVPVNATIGDADPERTAEAVRAAVERGFECCKLKVGRRSIAADVERVRRAREVAGSDAAIRIDANGAWTFDEAVEAIEAIAAHDVALVEQPLPAGALEGHAELRGRGVAIGLDEGLLEHGVDAIATSGAADAVVLKPMALGGVDVARGIAAWVRELSIETIVTTTIDAAVARTGTVHLAASIPDVPACGLATGDLLADDLGRDPVLFENGAAVVPQTKGLGMADVWSDR